MILYAKHLAAMSFALFLVPLLALWFARAAGAKFRLKRPGLTLSLALLRLGIALLVPVLAQGAFVVLGNRFLALAITGAVYGAFFGDAEDFPLVPAALFGALGGVGAAICYIAFPPSSEARSLCVAVFAVAPLLSYNAVTLAVRRRVAAGGLIVPSRRILR